MTDPPNEQKDSATNNTYPSYTLAWKIIPGLVKWSVTSVYKPFGRGTTWLLAPYKSLDDPPSEVLGHSSFILLVDVHHFLGKHVVSSSKREAHHFC